MTPGRVYAGILLVEDGRTLLDQDRPQPASNALEIVGELEGLAHAKSGGKKLARAFGLRESRDEARGKLEAP
jgi:hypothetical protein